MSAKRVIDAVGRAVREVGGTLAWHNGTRHRACVITLPNGRTVRHGISYGMNFDEMRAYKTLKGVLRREMKNDH